MNANHKIAGAPISWGVCEVPGWGYQLGPDRVLTEMREIGLLATELGPDGFLPAEPVAVADVLSEHGLRAIGGFTPLLLHVPEHDPVPPVERILDGYAASGATVLVLSADSGLTGYDTRPELDHARMANPVVQPGSRCGVGHGSGSSRCAASPRRHHDRKGA